ncbi:glycosyltransferase [Aliivibrio finisterrensis]|uniref:Glycosyltransferase n=1 Tax=Aliivibrio finisterrensis TaxID=511998 RepID=A0ABY0I4V0_9GAMM|nr:glycosyltransferase [Aliivibrio finisterrensis]RYU61827.1 glycosyltransferase [Aliivibrio finisterrensis]RYU80703.1 glycosyltransferase [Aliivibrio finisterrensis]
MFSVVIVTYNPKKNIFKFVDELKKIQEVNVIIVDNGSYDFDFTTLTDKVNLVKLKENFGIAKAQNIGVMHSIYDEVFFFDQDSFISNEKLIEILKYKNDNWQIKFGVIAPLVTNFYLKDKFKYNESDLFIETDIIQSSGSLVSKELYLSIGGVNEKLFIDCVEYDLNFRLKSLGYRNFILKNITLEHRFGDPGVIKGNKEYVRHSPIRYFYSSRNGVFLAKQKYTPMKFKLDFYISFLRGIKSLLVNKSSDLKCYFYCIKGWINGMFL